MRGYEQMILPCKYIYLRVVRGLLLHIIGLAFLFIGASA